MFCDPYRESDFRCEERTSLGERCMLTLGHWGLHTLPDGVIWMRAGDATPGDVICMRAGDSEEHRKVTVYGAPFMKSTPPFPILPRPKAEGEGGGNEPGSK